MTSYLSVGVNKEIWINQYGRIRLVDDYLMFVIKVYSDLKCFE